MFQNLYLVFAVLFCLIFLSSCTWPAKLEDLSVPCETDSSCENGYVCQNGYCQYVDYVIPAPDLLEDAIHDVLDDTFQDSTNNIIPDSFRDSAEELSEEEPELFCLDIDGDNHAGFGEGCNPGSVYFDCNEERPDVYRGAEELCDEIDNDCDGYVDEGFQCCENDEQQCYTGVPETMGVGECHNGIQRCQNSGRWGPCSEEQGPLNEVCDGLDNDCDGEIDENLPDCCVYSEEEISVRICYTGTIGTEGVGLCHSGIQECLEGEIWGLCFNQVTPGREVCDGFDNDCDGGIDRNQEGVLLSEECYYGPENTIGIGVCQGGTQLCNGGEWGLCSGLVVPGTETCSNFGSDDDCDGEADNIPGLGDSCETGGMGVCREGVMQCEGANLVCVSHTMPQLETCNSVDDDCDGEIDNGFDLESEANCGACYNACDESEICLAGFCVNDIDPSSMTIIPAGVFMTGT